MADNWIPDTRNRLAQRRAKKPATKAGQLWVLWPEIKAALEDGQSFKSIHQWLDEDAGITVSIPGLRSYVSRNRRKEAVLRQAETERAFFRAALSEELQPLTRIERDYSKAQKDEPLSKPRQEAEPPPDPMAGAMRALNKSRRLDIRDVHGDGDPNGKNLI